MYLWMHFGGVFLGLLGAAQINGHIDEEEHDRALRTLIARRYVRIPFTGKLLASAIRASLIGERTAAERMLATATDPVADRRAYAHVFGDALHRIWQEWPAGCGEKQREWADRLLETTHFEDRDSLWLQATVVAWIRRALQQDLGLGAAGCIRHVYDWFRAQPLDLELLAEALAQGACELGRDRDHAARLAASLTAGCPKAFQDWVRRKAVPKPGGGK
jgi:hypothetical protein